MTHDLNQTHFTLSISRCQTMCAGLLDDQEHVRRNPQLQFSIFPRLFGVPPQEIANSQVPQEARRSAFESVNMMRSFNQALEVKAPSRDAQLPPSSFQVRNAIHGRCLSSRGRGRVGCSPVERGCDCRNTTTGHVTLQEGRLSSWEPSVRARPTCKSWDGMSSRCIRLQKTSRSR